jgi:hypothetical protein
LPFFANEPLDFTIANSKRFFPVIGKSKSWNFITKKDYSATNPAILKSTLYSSFLIALN